MTNKTEIYKAYYHRNKDKADFKEKKSERNKRYYERKKQLKQLKQLNSVNDKILVVKVDNIKTSNIEDTQKLDETEITEITEQDKKIIVKVLEKIREIEMEQISNKIDEELSNNNALLDCELCRIEILDDFIKKIPRFSILNPEIAKRVILTKSKILLNKNKTRKTRKNGNYLRNFIVKAG